MNKVMRLMVAMVLLNGVVFAQKTTKKDEVKLPNPDSSGVYSKVDTMPSFPGGEDSLMNFLWRNLKYPQEAKETGKQGKVLLHFKVNVDGKISDVIIDKGVKGGCSEEAKRVIMLMPNWIPGKKDGNNVPVWFYLPIQFKLG